MSLDRISYRELKEQTSALDDKIGELSELPTDDKSSVVSALTEVFTSAGNGKAAVAAAITGKGVPTSASDTFAQMAENIGEIETGITPTGTKVISANGTYDVTAYAQASVNVSAQSPVLVTKNITANGTYDASGDNADGYSSVTVSVPTGSFNCKAFPLTLSENVSGRQLVINSDGDADIAAHRNDSSFVVGIMALNTTSSGSTRMIFVSNCSMHSATSGDVYGAYMQSSSQGVSTGNVQNAASSAPASKPGTMSVDAGGVIRAFASSYYPLLAGNYLVICAW